MSETADFKLKIMVKILANTEITNWNLTCAGEYYWNGARLRKTTLRTEKIYVDFLEMAFDAIIHIDKYKNKIFLN